MGSIAIPFNRPTLVGREQEAIAEALAEGHLSGDGRYTKECQALLEGQTGARKALLTTSCTDALEMCAVLLNLRPGDEVIVPSFTFVSTANAFVLRGARPVFADVRPDTLNIDERHLPGLITPRTRAIVVVHYAGVGCEMDRIMPVAEEHGIAVVEDNAHGLYGEYRGRNLGTFGCLATQSFHETKNITCGEGGALLINDPSLEERAEIIREKGTDRARFFRGQVDKYSWVDVGSSHLPSELLAAFLSVQLKSAEVIQAKRRRIWDYYYRHLRPWAEASGVILPAVPPHCRQPYHLFYMLLPSLDTRQGLIAHLKTCGILSAFHYVPLHLSTMGGRFGGYEGQCPVTEDVSNRLVRLPFYTGMTEDEQRDVVAAVTEYRADSGPRA